MPRTCRSISTRADTPISLTGDGGLSTEPPGDEPEDTYRYDPLDPNGMLWRIADGPVDDRLPSIRDDMLCYTSEVLSEPLTVVGPVSVTLYAASSARDTDWHVRLCDVHPDGSARFLCHGMLRARFRESFEQPQLLEPGPGLRLHLRRRRLRRALPAGSSHPGGSHQLAGSRSTTATPTPAPRTTSWTPRWWSPRTASSTSEAGRRTSRCRSCADRGSGRHRGLSPSSTICRGGPCVLPRTFAIHADEGQPTPTSWVPGLSVLRTVAGAKFTTPSSPHSRECSLHPRLEVART